MINSKRPAVVDRDVALPLILCRVASLLLLASAALGVVVWDRMPQFPPPASNDTLLALRRACILALAVIGVASLPWALRPRLIPLLGVGVHVFGVLAAIFTAVALRGDALAAVYWIPVAGSGAACLAIVWATVRASPGSTASAR